MARINDLQQGFTKTLALSFGKHVGQGHLIQHIEEFVGNEGDKQITLLMALGDGAPLDDGEGAWDGVEAVYYRGHLIDEANWHFHSGKRSTGDEDPVQGIDSFFPGGITYSGTVYIAIRLPVGIADEADPSGLDIIVRTSQIADYDEDGNVTGISYSANPARVKANLIKRRGKLSRIDWAKFVAARNYYDEEIDWESGTTLNGYEPFAGEPDVELHGPVSLVGTSGVTKAGGDEAWDNFTATVQLVRSLDEDGYFEVVAGTSDKQMAINVELTPSTPNAGHGEMGISLGGGVYWICYENICYAPLPYAAGDTFRIAIEGGVWVIRLNGNVIPFNGPEPPPPASAPMYGVMRVATPGGQFNSCTLNGFQVSSTAIVTSTIPRFEAHIAFTSAVNIDAAIDYVDLICCSDTVEAGRMIHFLTPEPRASVHTFDEDLNVVGGTVRVYNKRLKERPNRLWANFRNLNSQYLEEDFTPPQTRDDLFDKLGYIVDPGAMNFASMNPSQAQRTLAFQMRRQSDNFKYCDLTGMQDSYKVLKGDVVTVISKKFQRAPKDFVVLRATRESAESTALQRKFVLQEYFPNDYRDSDHSAAQPGLGTQPTSPFAPPGDPFLTLEQLAAEDLLKIRGHIAFPAFPSSLLASVYVTPPGGSEIFFDTVFPVAGTSAGTFDYIAEIEGEYTFRVVVESATGVPGGEYSASIEVSNLTLLVDRSTGLILIDRSTGNFLVDRAS
jgi:hypothetical protein